MARRIVWGILLMTGAWVAYPQASFPEHLSATGIFWNQSFDIPISVTGDQISDEWSDYSTTALSKLQAKSLEEALIILKGLAITLPKLEQDFVTKHGHLAVHLSGLNPHVTSNFDRSGPWLLSFPDARRYGLVVNESVDERRDFAKSTRAAMALFKDLKKTHGANSEVAFVLGSAGLIRARKSQIDKVEEELTGLRLIARDMDYKKLSPVANGMVTQRFLEEVDRVVLLVSLLITETQFQGWNPMLIGTKIPANYDIKLPTLVDAHQLANESRWLAESKKREQDSLMNSVKNDIPSPESHQVVTYRVKSGDVLGKISEKYGVSVSKIRKWNNLRSDRIDINQKLTIYFEKGKTIPKPTVAKEEPPQKEVVMALGNEVGKFTIYEVQPGDTLWAISKQFEGVKPEQIMAWNGIGEALSIGQKLKIKIQ